MYYPASGTFFTSVGELGMVLHEMWEYFSCAEELRQLEKKEPTLYETYES